MSNKHFTDELVNSINEDKTLDEVTKTKVLRNLTKLKDTKVNILITGATGCGKSSTINALFNSEKAKVGRGVDPETMDIAKYELENIVLFDSPGLGDSTEADARHAKKIINKLNEKDKDGNLLIDLVLVILNGSTKDLGTSYTLISDYIIPNIGDNKDRLLIAINRADMALDGDYWDNENNKPEPKLIKFLDEKIDSTRHRIKESTGVDVMPIYYSAGKKREDGKVVKNPYNLSKLLVFILRHTKVEKRAVFIQDLNKNENMWKYDENLVAHTIEIKESLWESVKSSASKGADIGEEIGSVFGSVGRTAGSAIGGAVGGAVGFIGSITGFW
jgi:predicted GTPase